MTPSGPVTDAPPSFMQAGFVAAMSVAVAHKVSIPHAGRLVTPNAAIVLLGNAHEHRRSRAIALALLPVEEVARRVRRPLKGPDDFTAEALLEYMARDTGNECLLLTFQGDLQEFLSGGGHWTSRARAIIKTLLDEPRDYTIVRSRQEALIIHQPRLTILTSLNPAILPELPRAGAEVASGFLSRLLTVVPANLEGTQVGLDYVPPRIRLPGQLTADNVARMATLLHERSEAARPFTGFAQDARAVFEDWCGAQEDQIKTGRVRDERFTTLRRYLPDHLLKLACLYQVDYDPEMQEVSRVALEEAMRFIAIAHGAIRRFEQPEGGLALSTYEQQTLEIVGALHRSTSSGDAYRTMPVAQLKRQTPRIPGRDFDAVVRDLGDRGIIDHKDTDKDNHKAASCRLLLEPNQVALMLLGSRSTPSLRLLTEGSAPPEAGGTSPSEGAKEAAGGAISVFGEKRVIPGGKAPRGTGRVPRWAKEPPPLPKASPGEDEEPTSIWGSGEEQAGFREDLEAPARITKDTGEDDAVAASPTATAGEDPRAEDEAPDDPASRSGT